MPLADRDLSMRRGTEHRCYWKEKVYERGTFPPGRGSVKGEQLQRERERERERQTTPDPSQVPRDSSNPRGSICRGSRDRSNPCQRALQSAPAPVPAPAPDNRCDFAIDIAIDIAIVEDSKCKAWLIGPGEHGGNIRRFFEYSLTLTLTLTLTQTALSRALCSPPYAEPHARSRPGRTPWVAG
jgi:hypothetical protein